MAKNKVENPTIPPDIEQSEESRASNQKVLDEKNCVSETVISGNPATEMYALLQKPPKNTQKNQLIQDALKRFPHPEQLTQLDIDL